MNLPLRSVYMLRCALLPALLLIALWAPGALCAEKLFAAPEQLADDDSYFSQRYAPFWKRVLSAEKRRPSFTADGAHLRQPDAAQWRRLVQRAKTSEELDVLRMVNGYFNQWPAIGDKEAWGEQEYWASPAEFISKRGGDCEDYVIAKYMALRFLGVSPQEMRLVIIRQVSSRGEPADQLHMVLAVQARGSWFILDNNSRPRDGVFRHTQYKGRFVPIYSFNELHVWKHSPDPAHNR